MKGTMALISILCCFSLQINQATAKNVTANVWEHHLPALKPKSSSRYLVNGTFAYSSCSDWKISSDGLVPLLGCEVTIESVDSAYSKTCSIVLRDVVHFAPRVVALTSDKAALLWTSGKLFPRLPVDERVISIVHFQDNCKVYEARLKLTPRTRVVKAISKYVPIVPYADGSFDVFYQDMNSCASGKFCRITFNDKAEVIGSEVPWLDVTWDGVVIVVAVVPGSPANGHLVLDYGRQSNTTVSYVDPRGHLKSLRNLEGVFRPSYSTTHNLLTLCRYTEMSSSHDVKQITCEQLDLDSSNNTVTISPFVIVPDETIMTTITTTNPTWFLHNLRAGGFLHRQRARVVKFAADGQKVGSVEVQGFDCKEEEQKMLLANVFEKEDGRYCFSGMCFGVDRPGVQREVVFGIACFTDEDFS